MSGSPTAAASTSRSSHKRAATSDSSAILQHSRTASTSSNSSFTSERVLHSSPPRDARAATSASILSSPISPPSKRRKREDVPDYLTTGSQAKAGHSSMKPLKARVLSKSTRLFVKRVKIDKEKGEELKELAALLGAVVTTVEHANIIVTDTWAPVRAKAGLRPEIYEQQAHVVHTSWLEDTAKQGIYLAIDKYRVLPAPPDTQAFAGPSRAGAGEVLTDTDGTDSDGGSVRSIAESESMRLPLRGLRVHVIPVKLDKSGLEGLRSRVAALGAEVVPQENADLILSAAASYARAKASLKTDLDKVTLLQSKWVDKVEERRNWEKIDEYLIAGLPSTPKLTNDDLRKTIKSRLGSPQSSPKSARKSSSKLATVTASRQSPSVESHPASPKEESQASDADESPVYSSREGSIAYSDNIMQSASNRSSGSRDGKKKEINPDDDDDLEKYPWVNSSFACERPSPLVCINQGLVDELAVLQKQRTLVGEHMHALAYERALSGIKSYREDLSKDPKAAGKIAGVGPKVVSLVKQYYETCSIAEAQQIRSDSALRIMMEFMELYGIGPTNARLLYNEGCRSVTDVIMAERSYGTKLKPKECLKLLPDLRQKIPRAEVESITTTVMDIANDLFPGCLHTICGGYRRGKPASGDVDVVITHDEVAPGELCQALVEKLKEEGLVTHTITVTHESRRASAGEASPTAHNVAELVFKAKATNDNPKPLHRRIDLIFCRRQVYGACVVGWSGSESLKHNKSLRQVESNGSGFPGTLFEKDIRRLAEKKFGYKFHNYGITDRTTEELFETPDEASVFDLLQMDWIPPRLRNCDA
ncbi:hypothetical protein OC845_006308 [Tilletia horrida]|nr:hypothetical protein OC845_006308 [Tilletia horrida]